MKRSVLMYVAALSMAVSSGVGQEHSQPESRPIAPQNDAVTAVSRMAAYRAALDSLQEEAVAIRTFRMVPGTAFFELPTGVALFSGSVTKPDFWTIRQQSSWNLTWQSQRNILQASNLRFQQPDAWSLRQQSYNRRFSQPDLWTLKQSVAGSWRGAPSIVRQPDYGRMLRQVESTRMNAQRTVDEARGWAALSIYANLSLGGAMAARPAATVLASTSHTTAAENWGWWLDRNAKNLRRMSEQWYKSTSKDEFASIEYHWKEHGFWERNFRSVDEYHQKALDFYRDNAMKARPIALKDGSGMGFKISGRDYFGIYDRTGKIVTFGKR